MASKTREKLIEVARQLFAHKGVAHTTMNDIANASSKGRRTIYTYFKSKKEIYNAVLEGESERLVEELRLIVSRDQPVEERLGAFLRSRLNRYLLPSSSTSFKAWISFDSRRLARIQKIAHAKEDEMMASLLAEGVAAGVFDSRRCELLQGFMPQAVMAVDSHSGSPEAPEGREEAVTRFVEFVLLGVTTKNVKTL